MRRRRARSNEGYQDPAEGLIQNGDESALFIGWSAAGDSGASAQASDDQINQAFGSVAEACDAADKRGGSVYPSWLSFTPERDIARVGEQSCNYANWMLWASRSCNVTVMASVVVVTRDVVGERMAGPGIRAYFLARELAKHFRTTLVAQLVGFEPAGEAFEVLDHRSIPAHNALQRTGIVIGQPDRQILGLSRRRHKFVYDLFDPNVLELRELYGLRPKFRQSVHLSREWGRLRMALSRGDVLIAGHRRQIDFYAGVHSSTGGKTSGGWLDRWIEVPFGIEETRPHPYPPDDPPTILWGGGVWGWLDPELAADAVIEANRRGIRCRLLFLGSSRPNSEVSGAGSVDQVAIRAKEHPHLIHLNHEWVPYRERDRWLRSCKAAIMLHRRTLEAEFSLRTRLFDALWCRIPVIASDGGFAAGLVREEEVGLVVEPSNLESVTQAVVNLVTDDALHKRSVSNLERIRSRFYWREVTRPLIQAISAWQ